MDQHSFKRSGSGGQNERGVASAATVAIVVPLYREPCTEQEHLALRVLNQVLGTHTIVALVPDKMRGQYKSLQGFDDEVVMPEEHFVSVNAYSALMLNAEFYSKLEAWDYVLIYQTDALVFSDQLAAWVAKGYDYIGAPWAGPQVLQSPLYRARYALKRSLLRRRQRPLTPRHRHRYSIGHVGNGGVSLRRVAAMQRALAQQPRLVREFIDGGMPDYPEDLFWCVDIDRTPQRLRLPQWREALEFAVEDAPEAALKLLGHPPFAAHGIDLSEQHTAVWHRVLRECGLG